jgi:predicted phosphatase
MDKLPDTLQTLERSLPEQFPFYHLGEISAESSPSPIRISKLELAGRAAVGVSLLGDVRALLLVLVEEGLDLSLYSEVANILASQLSNRLAISEGMDVVISAPSPVSAERLQTLLRPEREAAVRRYLHRDGQSTIQVEAVLLIDNAGKGGHA